MDQHLTPYASSPRTPLPPAPLLATAPLRIGEAERAAACDALAEHYAAGRLDPAELEDRLARAVAARTQADLRVLFVDLGPRRTVATVTEPAPPDRAGGNGLVPLLGSLLVLSVLLAGGMLMVLGAYNGALFLAALVGGTATAVAGVCGTVIARSTLRRR